MGALRVQVPCVTLLGRWLHALLISLLLLAATGGAASAQCIEAPDLAGYQLTASPDSAAGPTRSDRIGRVVAPILVNGRGPYRFVVDTGANRSALSQGLADELGLTSDGAGEVHSVYGVAPAPLVRVQSLQYGQLGLAGDVMPLLSGNVLAGEHGLLGVDGMRDRRLRMDFERNCIEIVPSSSARRLRGWAAMRGELRFGHLVVIRGSINGVHVHLLLDTGSDSTLANLALRDALNARIRRNRFLEATVAYNAGQPVVLSDAIAVPRMMVGELEVRNITAYVGDFHIFRLWQLVDEPTLLIGMDVLSQARGLAIDYGRGVVYIHVRDPLEFGTRLTN